MKQRPDLLSLSRKHRTLRVKGSGRRAYSKEIGSAQIPLLIGDNGLEGFVRPEYRCDDCGEVLLVRDASHAAVIRVGGCPGCGGMDGRVVETWE